MSPSRQFLPSPLLRIETPLVKGPGIISTEDETIQRLTERDLSRPTGC